jgi:signal transduction histidine kinase
MQHTGTYAARHRSSWLRRAIARIPNWRLALRSAFVSLALFGTMAAAAAAAWGVYDAGVEHERAVDESLGEYAKWAARTFGEQMVNEGAELRYRAMAVVAGTRAPDSTATLSLDYFAQRAGAALDEIGFLGDTLRGYFAVDLKLERFRGSGFAGRSDVAVAIAEAMRPRLPFIARSRLSLLSNIEIAGEAVNVVFDAQRDESGEPIAVYGFTVSRTLWMTLLGAEILRQFPLVPPSFISSEWRYGGDVAGIDTAVAIQVIDRRGQELYRSPRQFQSSVRGEFSLRTVPGGFTVRATLHPDFVWRITSLHRHDERRQLQYALQGLTILLAVAVILNLMRERELVRARRDFVASVSHDLRTPLAQIRMFSETLMLRRERDEEERLRWIGVIGREARRLGDLVENILLFSHTEAARLRLEPERTDLGELVEDVVEAYVPIAAAQRMRLLADAPSRINVMVDPRATRQVVVNLLDNALKYGPEGQTITVEVEREGDQAFLAVSDQGPGIPEKDRERVWGRFVRLGRERGTARSSTSGSGIGLSVVRTLVEGHGGTAWVEDAGMGPGTGARFMISFPLADPAISASAIPSRGSQNPTTTERTESAASSPVGVGAAYHQKTTASRAPGA